MAGSCLKRIKKITCMVLAVCLAAVTFSACGNESGNTGTGDGQTLTVAKEEITAAECTYYYTYYLSQNGIDVSTDEGLGQLASPTGLKEYPTVNDYIRHLVASEIQRTVICLKKAQELGWTVPTEKAAKSAETDMLDLENDSKQAGITVEEYVKKMWGDEVTPDDIRQVFNRMYTAKEYYDTVFMPQWVPSENEIEKYYGKNSADYDKVDFRAFFFAYTSEDEQVRKTQAANAREMCGRITDEKSFAALAEEYAQEDMKLLYSDESYTLQKGVLKQLLNEAPAKWLFDAKRAAGDKDIVEDESGIYVLYFINRVKPEEPMVTIRQLTLELGSTPQEQQQSHTLAAELVKKAVSEEEMQKLVDKYATQSAEKECGGLYQNVYRGGQPEELDEWCFDPARKAGDTALIETQYGRHILYFVSATQDAEWHARVYKRIMTDKAEKELSKLRKKYPYKFS